jgi:hypothetical protein
MRSTISIKKAIPQFNQSRNQRYRSTSHQPVSYRQRSRMSHVSYENVFSLHLILFHMPNKFYTHAKIRLYSASWEHNRTHQQDSTSYNVFHISIDINVSCHSFIQPTNQGSRAENARTHHTHSLDSTEQTSVRNVIKYLNKLGHHTEE